MKQDSNVITGGYLVKCIIVDPQFIVNGSFVTFDQVSSHFAGLFLSSVSDDREEMVGFPTSSSVGGGVGPTGPTGATGSQGIPGQDGIDGEQGDIGFPGGRGLQGVQGYIGPQGDEGLEGEQGIIGPQGPQGVQGPIGLSMAQSDDLIALLNYAFNRIRSLEQALGIDYGPSDIFVPDQVSLLDEQQTSGVF